MLLASEARRKALIRRLTLETFGEECPQALPETDARVVERDAIRQQEIDNFVPGEDARPIHIPANAVTGSRPLPFSRVFQQDGMLCRRLCSC
jgi:hypothetical protein